MIDLDLRMDHSTAILADQRPNPNGGPAAPSPAALPLPASPPPRPSPANDPPSEISYESISPSDRSVFNRKVRRYQDWTDDVTRQGGVDVSESSFGRAGGVGSASLGSLPTIKALSRDGTEPSTIVEQRVRARHALKNPTTHGPLRPIHYAPLVFPSDVTVDKARLQEMFQPPMVASRIVETPAPMTSLEHLSPTGPIPLARQGSVSQQKPLSRQPSHSNMRRPSPAPQKSVSRQPSRQEMRRPSPTPYLAKPQLNVSQVDHPAGPSSKPLTPIPSRQNLAIPPAIGSDRPSSGRSGRSTHSAYKEREAYLSSALLLPLEMLSEKQSDPEAPIRRNSVKRWTSLLRRKSKQSVTGTTRQPRVLSGPEATLPSGGSSLKKKPSDRRKDAPAQLTRSHTTGADVSQEKGRAKKATMSSVSLPAKEKDSLRSQHSIRKPLPPGPEVVITAAASRTGTRRDEIEILDTPHHRLGQDDNALQLDPGYKRDAHHAFSRQGEMISALGRASSRTTARPTHTQAPQNTPTQQRHPSAGHRPGYPADLAMIQASPIHPSHRQRLPLSRPALSREVSSIDGLTKTLGRRHRDPSLTNLTARFDPEMYSLPDSAPTGDERTESPVKPSRVHHSVSAGLPDLSQHPPVQTHQSHPLSQPHVDPHPSLAARRSKPVGPVQVTPELLHPQPHSAVAPRVHELASPHDSAAPRTRSRSPVRVTSPSQRREVQFSPQGRPREDEEEVRFEVPSRSHGRLRVSVAWLRDRQRIGESEIESNGSPPPVPPKGPASLVDRFKRKTRDEAQSPQAEARSRPGDDVAYPAPPSVSQPHSPTPIGRFFNPFWSNGRLPAYSPPPLPQVYQMQQGMAYPQLGIPYGPWLHPGQAYQQPPKTHRPASPPRPPSIDPPSSQGSPVAQPAGLPHVPAPYPGQPGMPWYPQPGQPVPSQYPGRMYGNRYQGGRRAGPSLWQKIFKGWKDEDEDPISDWQRGVTQAPPAPHTVMPRGPLTAPVYREPRYPKSQRTAWWRRQPASAWTNDQRTMAQEEYMRRDEMQRYDSQYRRDGRRPPRGDGGSVWDIFRRRTDEVYIRSPPPRNAPLPPPAPSTHPAPIHSPTRQQGSNRTQYQRQRQIVRPGIAQRWSSRKWMNGKVGPSGNDRVLRPSRPARNGFQSHTERQQAKTQRRENKRQRREAREQRRQAYVSRDRTDGRFFSTRPRGRQAGGSMLLDRKGRGTVHNERDRRDGRDGRGRDMGMVGDWARGLTSLFRDPDRSRIARGGSR